MTIDADRLANLRSRIERAEDAAAHLDGDIGRMWAERYAGDVAFLLGALTATGPGSGAAKQIADSLRDGTFRGVSPKEYDDQAARDRDQDRHRLSAEGASGAREDVSSPASKGSGDDGGAPLQDRGSVPPAGHPASARLGAGLECEAARPDLAAPQTDHRAAPACVCHRAAGGVDPWCPVHGASNLAVEEKARGIATPPSGSPPAVTEPDFHDDGRGMLCDCSMPSRHKRAAAPGEPVTSGSPQGAAEAEPWVIVAAHLSTEGVAYFWGPSFSGYTRLVEKAGRYTEAEAKSREVWSERMEVAVPRAEAIAAARLHVSDDHAHGWFRRRFPGPKPGSPPESPDGSSAPPSGERR